MAITQSQFQINLVQEFFKAGGPFKEKTQINQDPLRPLLQGNITLGFQRGYAGPVEVTVSDININSETSIFGQECFEFSCVDNTDPNNIFVHRLYEETGLVTNIEGVSDICFTRWNPNPSIPSVFKYEYVNQDFHYLLPNASCNLDINGRKKFFVRATPDINGAVYVADIGYINLVGRSIVIVEKNVPFFATNQPGVIKARSVTTVSSGIKVAIVKKVTLNSVETLGTVYGELDTAFYLPHTTLISNRELKAEDQGIDLENLSVNLLLLTTLKSFETRENQIIYRSRNFSSPLLESTIQQSIGTLSALINQDENVPQIGSIPAKITNYLKTQLEYSANADDIYTEQSISCFDLECYESNCFTTFLNKSLIYRDISNRALGWTMQFFASYVVAYSEPIYIQGLESIANYLDNQKQANNLYYKGWIDPNLYDNYENMIVDGEFECSTQCSIFMGFLKAFEVTQNFFYLELACELYEAINKYFLNGDGLYVHSLSDKNPSVESVTYQLLLVQILEDYNHINSILAFLKSRLNALPISTEARIIVSDGCVVFNDANNVVITPPVQLVDPEDNNLFVLTTSDTVTELDDIFKLNYLNYSSLINLSNIISIDFFDEVKAKYNFIYEDIVEDRNEATLIFTISNLLENTTFTKIEATQFNCVPEFNNLKFNTHRVYFDMLNAMPRDYHWFRPEVLNKKSRLGKMLFSMAYAQSHIYTRVNFLDRMSDINNMYGILLNKKAADFSLIRLQKETDSALRSRIFSEIANEAVTKLDIENKLLLYDNSIEIKDNYKVMSAFEQRGETLFQDVWGSGLLQGRNVASSNRVSVFSEQPIETDVFNIINSVKPAGVELTLVENMVFTAGSSIESGTGFRMTDINASCDNIRLEQNEDVKTEDGFNICLEDDETVPYTFLPPAPPPPVDPPAEVEDTCDCEWLRGFITIDTIPTQLRTMRIVEEPPASGDFYYDVNATNGTVEPCDLAITSSLLNDAQTYLEMLYLGSVPTFMSNARRIDHVFNTGSNEFNIIWFDGTTQAAAISKTDLLSPTALAETSLPSIDSGNFKLHELISHYVILNSALDIVVINKSTLAVNIISTPFDANVTEVEFLPDSDTSVRIYSRQSTDNTIYHYFFDEATPTIITSLNSVLTTDTRTHNYYITTAGIIRYSIDSTDILVYDTPAFDELGTVKYTLPALDIGDNLTYIDNIGDQIFLTSEVAGSPFSTVDVYSNIGSLLTYKVGTTSIFSLEYLDTNNADFYNTGDPYLLGNYMLFKGTNNVHSLESNSTQALNTFICPSDVTTLDSGFVVQSIDVDPSTENAVLISAVDTVNVLWGIWQVKLSKKVCV